MCYPAVGIARCKSRRLSEKRGSELPAPRCLLPPGYAVNCVTSDALRRDYAMIAIHTTNRVASSLNRDCHLGIDNKLPRIVLIAPSTYPNASAFTIPRP